MDSLRNLLFNTPENTCHPGFVENCHLLNILLRGKRERDRKPENYVFYSISMCDVYSSSSCDRGMHVLSALLYTYFMSYAQDLQQQLRESYVYEYVVYST